jgi:[acyl-carrier-protein] S-malonyltransferase
MSQFAFVFPGQGSQSVGMLDAWADHPVVRQTLQEASDALGENLEQLIHAGPKEALALTTNTQPVMLVSAIANYRVWIEQGGATPSAVAGHSLGEYSALVAAGSLSLAQAVALVRLRARAMQEAVPVGQGAMAAILGLDASLVVQGCEQALQQLGSDEVVSAANFNDPAQTVIAGSKAGVDKACEILKTMGAKRALLLPVSAPFHCKLMLPAAQALRQALEGIEFQPPKIPVINNIDVQQKTDASDIRDALYRQAFGPVRWVECIQAIKALGLGTVIECGPGKVLAGLTKRIDPAIQSAALYDPTTLEEVRNLLQT